MAAVAQEIKTVKKATSTKKAKTSPSHPPYINMIKEALVALKERTGSSQYAIAKHIEEQQKVKGLPPNFKKLLSNQLKKLAASGKLVKVKSSFKLPAKATAEKPKPKPKAKTAAKKKPAAKKVKVAKSPAKAKKVGAVKAKKPKSIKSPAKKAVAVKKTPAKKVKKTPAKKA